MSMNELEQRCLRFAKDVRDYCRTKKSDTINLVYIKQVVRSSSSIGANYIEANERLGDKDILMKMKIARREAKETEYWLELLQVDNDEVAVRLKNEALQLRKIISAMINKLSLSGQTN